MITNSEEKEVKYKMAPFMHDAGEYRAVNNKSR
jgi:hypothetical protein